MRAVVCRRFEGIDALELGELPDPVPGPLQVLVEVHAASLSSMDLLMVSGRCRLRPQLPFAPGAGAAGVVLSVGADVKRVRVGDRVACSHAHGGMAERMVAPESGIVGLPEGMSFETGSTIRYPYATAHYLLVRRAELRPGDTVFVSGAAGTVGMAAIDVACHLGATVIAGTGSPARNAVARQQGAAHAIDYSSEPVRDRLMELTDGRGVDVYVDTVGGALFAEVARAMAWDGRILPVGFAGDEAPELAMDVPRLKHCSVVGCCWGAWSDRYPQQSQAADEYIFSLVGQGRFRPQPFDLWPMAAYARALKRIADGSSLSRPVLEIKKDPLATADAGLEAAGSSRPNPSAATLRS